MADNDLTAKLKIDGDGSGASKAVDGVQKSLDGVSGAAERVSAQLRAMAAAAEGFEVPRGALDSVDKLKTGVDAAGKSFGSLDTEAKAATQDLSQAAKAAGAIDAAFKTLGVKPLKDVRAETEKLQAALATIKSTGIIGPDQERAVAALKVKLAELRAEAGAVPSAAAQAKSGIAGVGSAASASESALGGMAGKVAAAVTALASFGAVTSVASDIIKTGAAFETLEARLTSMLGSTEAAKEAMGQIKQLAITTPFEVSALAESFVNLTAFGLQPSMEQMRALADTAATLGGGTESLAGVTRALGQAWAKGKLQGEEIMQMAERGVPVWDVLATATGKNTTELQKMSEAGELGRGTILKLIDALGEMNAGASEKMMATFSGAVSNAKDALAEFYDMIAKAGVLDFLTKQVQDLLAEFDRMKQTGELDAAAKRMADGFIAVGEGIRSAIEAINALSGVIKFSLEAFVAWRLAGMTLIPVLGGVGATAGATAVQAAALGVASEKAAIGMEAMAVAGRLLKGLALIGLVESAVSLSIEFLRAKKAAEDGDRAVRKMLEPVAVNGPRDAIKAVVTETEAARFKLTEYQRSLAEMVLQGKSTGDALTEMVKKGDFSTVKGVGDFLDGMKSIREGAQATGEEIRVSIQERLNKMSGEDLRVFGEQAQTAFKLGKISAEELATTLNGTVDAALKKLGSNTETFAGGMTAKFIEVSQTIGVVENNFDRLKDSGQNASLILKEAFAGGLVAAKSIQDFEALEISIKAAGEAGRLSKQEVVDFLDKTREKIDAVTPGVNSLSEAFKTLGMKSSEELNKVANSAEAAFQKIKDSGNASLADVQEAFRRYAAAAMASNGGVATETLQVQARMQGLQIVTDETGKVIIRAMGQGVVSVDDLTQSTEAATRGFGDLADAADRAATSTEGVRGPGERVAGVDVKSVLYKNGATVEEAKAAEKYYGELYQREAATRLTGNLGTDANAAYQTNLAQKFAAEEALRLARQELATGKAVDLGTPVNELIAKNRATGNIGLTSLGGENNLLKDIEYAGLAAKASPAAVAAAKATNPYAPAPSVSYTVDLRTDNGTSSVGVNTEKDAKDLFDALKSYAARAA